EYFQTDLSQNKTVELSTISKSECNTNKIGGDDNGGFTISLDGTNASVTTTEGSSAEIISSTTTYDDVSRTFTLEYDFVIGADTTRAYDTLIFRNKYLTYEEW
ncbi:MAG: hypothetical protein MI922_28075, partial [Bacteroidales bacterium]|nr:hypothetical protein [Bacteroidales bacterium]